MRTLVTGAAGFIGSTLCEHLLAEGHEVVAIDAFTEYYDPAIKRGNAEAVARAGTPVLDADLREVDLAPLLEDCEVVFHLAAQPGVRASWAQFETYTAHNLVATQRLLEAVREAGVRRTVVASSSSVYGDATRFPAQESDPLRPRSPYGVTKRAVEDLCAAHADNWDTDTVLLRYFTVYGPRQRPDMAMQRLVRAASGGPAFPLYGDGSARRDFTYVDDAVRATVLAATADTRPGTALNIAGGSDASMRQVIEHIEALAGPVAIDQRDEQPGDVRRTGGDTTSASTLLGWEPRIGLAEGLAAQVEWNRARTDLSGT